MRLEPGAGIQPPFCICDPSERRGFARAKPLGAGHEEAVALVAEWFPNMGKWDCVVASG